MNHFEALGRYHALKEALEAAQYRRHAELHNLGNDIARAANDPRLPFIPAEYRARLEGALETEAKLRELELQFAAAKAECGKQG